MAKPKKKPAPSWRLYLVVAVDPYWNGKQYRGRFYKYGITTKSNVLDRHPSYTEVLLDLPLGQGGMGEYMESAISENLRHNKFQAGSEFSVEAVSCERIGADAMKVLVEAVYQGSRTDWDRIDCSSRKSTEWAPIGGYKPHGARFDARMLLSYLEWSEDGLIAEEPKRFKPLDKAVLANEVLFYEHRQNVIAIRWRERFVAAYNGWALATKAVGRIPEPMWA